MGYPLCGLFFFIFFVSLAFSHLHFFQEVALDCPFQNLYIIGLIFAVVFTFILRRSLCPTRV
jgi:hypothetical protein